MTYVSDVYMFNVLETIATDHNLLAETMRNTARAELDACEGQPISERAQVLAEALRKIASHGSITWMRRTAADALTTYRRSSDGVQKEPVDPVTAAWFAQVNDLLGELRETLDTDCDDLDRIEETVEGLSRRITQAEAAIGALTGRLEHTINSTVGSFDTQDNLNILNVEAHKKLTHDLAEAIQEHEYMHHTPASAVGGPLPPLHCDSPTIFLDEDRTTPYQLAADGQVQLLREPVELFADEVDQVEQDALREEPERVPEPLPEEAPPGPRSDSDGSPWDFQLGDTLELFFLGAWRFLTVKSLNLHYVMVISETGLELAYTRYYLWRKGHNFKRAVA